MTLLAAYAVIDDLTTVDPWSAPAEGDKGNPSKPPTPSQQESRNRAVAQRQGAIVVPG